MSGTTENQTILSELHYCGTVQYFAYLLGADHLIIEQHEHYSKGSYRNRCYIAGANGKLRLTVPLEKGKNDGTPIRDVRIFNFKPWQTLQWRSIASAYGKSPYFQHYAHLLAPHFDKRYAFLFDLNFELTRTLLEILGIDISVTFSDVYNKLPGKDVADLRNVFLPKYSNQSREAGNNHELYPQVFADRFGFIPNLSVLDLIFCKGPESLNVLESERKLML